MKPAWRLKAFRISERINFYLSCQIVKGYEILSSHNQQLETRNILDALQERVTYIYGLQVTVHITTEGADWF